jgi:hypothetical protein
MPRNYVEWDHGYATSIARAQGASVGATGGTLFALLERHAGDGTRPTDLPNKIVPLAIASRETPPVFKPTQILSGPSLAVRPSKCYFLLRHPTTEPMPALLRTRRSSRHVTIGSRASGELAS